MPAPYSAGVPLSLPRNGSLIFQTWMRIHPVGRRAFRCTSCAIVSYEKRNSRTSISRMARGAIVSAAAAHAFATFPGRMILRSKGRIEGDGSGTLAPRPAPEPFHQPCSHAASPAAQWPRRCASAPL
jgi:hypothetical protein